MYIETWRWRIVIAVLGLGLIWAGGYGVFHPDSMLINICHSQSSVFLQRLNVVLSDAAFALTALGGGALEWYVWYSIRKGLAMREDRAPIDWPSVRRKAIVYALLIVLMAAVITLVAPMLLKGTTMDPNAPQPTAKP